MASVHFIPHCLCDYHIVEFGSVEHDNSRAIDADADAFEHGRSYIADRYRYRYRSTDIWFA